MGNELTKEDIKNSIEYKWRIELIKNLLFSYLINLLATLPIMLFSLEFDDLLLAFIIWVIWNLIFGVFFLANIFYYLYKNKYLFKNYHKFKSYIVVLDHPYNSYSYKRSTYYTCLIEDNYIKKNVCTNSCFSNDNIEEFNNQKVIGLYDDVLEKIYVIKKI